MAYFPNKVKHEIRGTQKYFKFPRKACLVTRFLLSSYLDIPNRVSSSFVSSVSPCTVNNKTTGPNLINIEVPSVFYLFVCFIYTQTFTNINTRLSKKNDYGTSTRTPRRQIYLTLVCTRLTEHMLTVTNFLLQA